MFSLLLLPNGIFSMEHAVQDSEEPVGPSVSVVEVENFDLNIASDGGCNQQTIAPKLAPVVGTLRVVSDWELQRHIGNLLDRSSSYEKNPASAQQQLLRDGIDVTLSAVQRNMLDYLLKRAIQWALSQNYRAFNACSNRPSVYGAEAVLAHIHHGRTGGFPGTTLSTVKRLMSELVACDEDLALQLGRVRTGAGGSKDNVYQMLLREGFQVERSRVEKIYYQYRGCWQWAS